MWHLTHLAEFRRVLLDHGLSPWLIRILSRTVPLTEAFVGTLGLVTLSLSPNMSAMLALSSTCIYLAYATHLARVAATRPHTSCGCGPGETAVGPWVTGRALALATAAASAFVWLMSERQLLTIDAWFGYLGGGIIALGVWILPGINIAPLGEPP